MYPGKPITKKLTKMSTGKPITNFFRVNQLGLSFSYIQVFQGGENFQYFCQSINYVPSFKTASNIIIINF